MANYLSNFSHLTLFPAGDQVFFSWLVSFLQTKNKAVFALIGALIGWSVVFGLLNPVFAQTLEPTSSAITITPTFQELTIDASQDSQTGQITVFNQGDTEQTFELMAVTVNQIDSQGNVILNDKPLSSDDAPQSAFVTFPESSVIVGADQEKVINFTVTNSQNLTPGGNYVVIVLKAQPNQNQPSVNQSVLPAISSFVLIRKLGGEQYNLSLSAINDGDFPIWWQLPKSMSLIFENQGNIHTTPRGQIKISDIFGRVVGEGTINESSQFVFPRTQREILINLRQIRPSWPFMLYTLTAQGQSEPGEVTFSQQTYSLFLSSTVGLAMLLLIGLISLGYIIIVQFKKRKHARKIS